MGKSSIDWHSPIAMLNHEGIAVCWARGVLSISPGKSWKSHWHDENTPAGDNRLAMWVFAPGCDAKHRSVCSYSFQPLISGRFYASSCQGLDKSMSTSLIATTFCSMLSCTHPNHPQSSPHPMPQSSHFAMWGSSLYLLQHWWQVGSLNSPGSSRLVDGQTHCIHNQPLGSPSHPLPRGPLNEERKHSLGKTTKYM